MVLVRMSVGLLVVGVHYDAQALQSSVSWAASALSIFSMTKAATFSASALVLHPFHAGWRERWSGAAAVAHR
jgi:hypothetical protein